MSKMVTLEGVGTIDVDYVVAEKVYLDERLPSGKKKQKLVWICPYYLKWKDMIIRCYSKREQSRHPTYKGCTVCEEWLLFSNFRKWMVTQDWKNKQLDKDLLFQGNKIYSPSTCVFLHRKVNTFIVVGSEGRSGNLRGSHLYRTGKFKSSCKDFLTGKTINLGYFVLELDAHLAWKEEKHKQACIMADSVFVTDERVANLLKSRYVNFHILE